MKHIQLEATDRFPTAYLARAGLRPATFVACGLLTLLLDVRGASGQETEGSPRETLATTAQSELTGWKGASVDSLRLLTIQHLWRISFQHKTHKELGGPFLSDYVHSMRMPRRWSDGDSGLTNNFGHPIQGAASGYIWLNNTGRGGTPSAFDSSYWRSRLEATAWSFGYSEQFENGLYSEASIGNVGLDPRTIGWSDHVMTPLGGLAMMVGEDALDRFVLARLEKRIRSRVLIATLRTMMVPSQATANIAGGRAPWHRVDRPLR